MINVNMKVILMVVIKSMEKENLLIQIIQPMKDNFIVELNKDKE